MLPIFINLFLKKIAENLHLIYQLNHTIVDYTLFPYALVGNDYILFNPHDYFLNKKIKEEYPLFFSLA